MFGCFNRCSNRCCRRPSCSPCAPCPPSPPTLFTIVYNPNGGTGIFIDYGGSTYLVKSDIETGISRPGFIFVGWNTSPDGTGITYLPGQIINLCQSLNLYAQWVPVPATTVSVTYSANGGVGGSVDSGLPIGLPYTIKNEDAVGISNPGFTFVNWNTSPDGTGTVYEPGAVVSLVGDLTLYAQWTPVI